MYIKLVYDNVRSDVICFIQCLVNWQ